MKRTITLLFALVWMLAGGRLWAEPVFIVGHKVTLRTIDRATMDKILKGKLKNWPTGERIQLVLLKDGQVHESILSTYANMNDSQFSSYWNSLVFTGKIAAPKSFANEADAIRFVAESDYAVGYAERSRLSASVQILRVE